MKIYITALLLGISLLSLGHDNDEDADVSDIEFGSQSPFSIEIGDRLVQYTKSSVYVLPGETLELIYKTDEPNSDDIFHPLELFSLLADWKLLQDGNWLWEAPQTPGNYEITLTQPDTLEAIKINAFVLYPYDEIKKGKLNNYKIGKYPKFEKSGYEPPKGFIEIKDAATENLWVSPHFKLGQFSCKQSASYPKYMALDARLLDRLEGILDEAKSRGLDWDRFEVLSGFRTPNHNARTPGRARFSRHQYGDAADIIVPGPDGKRMRDLNSDGKVNVKDALYLQSMIDDLEDTDESGRFPSGGVGIYQHSVHHGTYVHVDARGTRADGKTPRWKDRPHRRAGKHLRVKRRRSR